MEQNRWTAGFDGNALPRDGSGLVFDSTVLIDAAYIPPRTTLYARSWALPDAVPDTEGPHGDGNHHGPEHATP